MEWVAKIKLDDVIEKSNKMKFFKVKRSKKRLARRLNQYNCMKAFIPQINKAKNIHDLNHVLLAIYTYCSSYLIKVE